MHYLIHMATDTVMVIRTLHTEDMEDIIKLFMLYMIQHKEERAIHCLLSIFLSFKSLEIFYSV